MSDRTSPSPQPQMVGSDLPADIIESLLSIGPVEWGQTHKQNDGKHIDDLEDTLRLTRQHFGIEDKETAIHGLYLEGTSVVLAHTGMSPNSPQHARILAGAWNQLVEVAKAQRADLSSASASHAGGIIAAFEEEYPDFYYHVAKGKITAGEPLYGAIITTVLGTEIGHGESDVSAEDAFKKAIDHATDRIRAALSSEVEG